MSEEVYLYIVHCLDDLSCGMVDNGARFGGSTKRIGCYTDHRAYQDATADPANPQFIKKIGSGPLESEDGKYMIGSMFILEATRKAVDEFIRNDPFTAAEVWERVVVTRWLSPNGISPMQAVMQNNDRSTMKMVSIPESSSS